MTKVDTTIIKIGGSWYVRIPRTLAEGFGIVESGIIPIEDRGNQAVLTFPEKD